MLLSIEALPRIRADFGEQLNSCFQKSGADLPSRLRASKSTSFGNSFPATSVKVILILPLAGSVGSLLGQRNLDKGNSSRKSDFVLRLTLGCEVVLFILLPMIRSVFIMGK